jgi:hypothetical protein
VPAAGPLRVVCGCAWSCPDGSGLQRVLLGAAVGVAGFLLPAGLSSTVWQLAIW